MELNLGVIGLLKLLQKLIAHKFEQSSLATKECIIVDTNYGRVRGIKRKNVYEAYDNYFAFEGIPYAQPPLGELRFRSPQPPKPWKNVLDCLQYKPKPLQKDYFRKIVQGSEDCLYLNVYAKTLNSEKPLPVMVWIYGGGFQIGEASREVYSPDYFMQKDVILVTFSYRLGALGFLSFNDPDLQIPGNAGLKDQVMALKWIKENIEFFNGDPNNITLFGESAGAASIHFLMLTDQTKGVFHKAILQSGTALCPWVNTPPRNWAFRLASVIGYKGDNNDKDIYRFLVKQNPKHLTYGSTVLITKQEKFDTLIFAFGPVVEPYLSKDSIITKPIKELLPTTWSNDIPVIIGANSFEGLFLYGVVMRSNFLVNDLTDCINLIPDDVKPKHNYQELNDMALTIKQTYFGNKSPSLKETLFEYLDLMSYRSFWHSIYRTIKARSAYAPHAATFCYVFDFDSPFFNHFRVLNCGSSVRGVAHCDDVSYLFYNVTAEKLSTSSAEFKCIQRMVGMWYNFALTSNPTCKEIEPIKWQPIENETDPQKPINVLNISDEIEFKGLPIHDKLKIWDNLYTKESLY